MTFRATLPKTKFLGRPGLRSENLDRLQWVGWVRR